MCCLVLSCVVFCCVCLFSRQHRPLRYGGCNNSFDEINTQPRNRRLYWTAGTCTNMRWHGTARHSMALDARCAIFFVGFGGRTQVRRGLILSHAACSLPVDCVAGTLKKSHRRALESAVRYNSRSRSCSRSIVEMHRSTVSRIRYGTYSIGTLSLELYGTVMSTSTVGITNSRPRMEYYCSCLLYYHTRTVLIRTCPWRHRRTLF